MRGTVKERFNAKWIPEPYSGCWLWIGSTTGKSNYGQLCHKLAHRISWELNRGAIPYDMDVLHKCDVRLCVNPDHLFLGTDSDNQRDCVLKGRNADHRGELAPASKLTEQQVLQIRRSTNKTKTELALEYGVVRSTITWIQSGKTWRHLL